MPATSPVLLSGHGHNETAPMQIDLFAQSCLAQSVSRRLGDCVVVPGSSRLRLALWPSKSIVLVHSGWLAQVVSSRLSLASELQLVIVGLLVVVLAAASFPSQRVASIFLRVHFLVGPLVPGRGGGLFRFCLRP